MQTAGCCFVKIGHADAMVSPKLFPGMIVSVDRSCQLRAIAMAAHPQKICGYWNNPKG